MKPLINKTYQHYTEENPQPVVNENKAFLNQWNEKVADVNYEINTEQAQKEANKAGYADWFSNGFWAAPENARVLLRRQVPSEYDPSEIINLHGINGNTTYNNMIVTPIKEKADTAYYDLNNSYDPKYIAMLKQKYENTILNPTTVGATAEDHAYLQKERARIQGLKRIK